MELQLQDKTVYYQVQYSSRSKMTMEMTPEGLITIKAPKKTDKQEIESFLRKNENAKAILHLYQYLENRQFISSKKEHVEDENYLYLGKAYQLSELPGFWDKVCNMNEKSMLQGSSDTELKETDTLSGSFQIPEGMDIELELKKFYTKET